MVDNKLRELERIAKTTRAIEDVRIYAMALKRVQPNTRSVYRIINNKGHHLAKFAEAAVDATSTNTYYKNASATQYFTKSSGLTFSKLADAHRFVAKLNKKRPDVLKNCKVIEVFNLALDVCSNMEEFLAESERLLAEEERKQKELKLEELKNQINKIEKELNSES